MLIEAMAFQSQGLSNAGVQAKPGRGQEAEGLRSCPAGSPGVGTTSTTLLPVLSPSLLLPAKGGSVGQPAKADEGVYSEKKNTFICICVAET